MALSSARTVQHGPAAGVGGASDLLRGKRQSHRKAGRVSTRWAGGGSDPKQRRFFHPAKYRIVNFDQRGCGKSTPYASLEENTTWDLVADIEKIREHLGIEWRRSPIYISFYTDVPGGIGNEAYGSNRGNT